RHRRVDVDVWPGTIALRQLALVECLVHDLAQGVDPALLGRPAVVLPEPLGKRIDRSLEGSAGLRIHDPAEVVHAIHLADVEEALLVVLFRVALEPIRIHRIASVGGEPAQVFDGVLAGEADPLLLVEAGGLLAQLVSQMTDHRGRLVADLAPGEGTSNHRHRLQLLADTNPVEGRWHRHSAGLADPGGGGDVAAAEVLARFLRLPHLGSELALEDIDHLTQALGVDALLASLKLAHRGLQLREGSNPYPYHEKNCTKQMFGVNTLAGKSHLKAKKKPDPTRRSAPTSPKNRGGNEPHSQPALGLQAPPEPPSSRPVPRAP